MCLEQPESWGQKVEGPKGEEEEERLFHGYRVSVGESEGGLETDGGYGRTIF